MFNISRALAINPPELGPDEPRLSRADVWHGLELKANNALPFVPSITHCVVLERHGEREFVREIDFRGVRSKERVTLEPEQRVTFERISGTVSGRILNEIEEDAEGELQLRFTYALEVDGIAAGSQAEQDYADDMEGEYLKALTATLAAVRELAKDEAER